MIINTDTVVLFSGFVLRTLHISIPLTSKQPYEVNTIVIWDKKTDWGTKKLSKSPKVRIQLSHLCRCGTVSKSVQRMHVWLAEKHLFRNDDFPPACMGCLTVPTPRSPARDYRNDSHAHIPSQSSLSLESHTLWEESGMFLELEEGLIFKC